MKVRRTPPLIAQITAALVLLTTFFVAGGYLSIFMGPHSSGHLADPPPSWTPLLHLIATLPFFTLPALAYKLTHQFFCWSSRGYGYPERPPPLRFAHLIFLSFSTLTIGSNVLFWTLYREGIWIPPYLESILRFGMQQSAVVVFISSASLFFVARKTFWSGLVISATSLILYYLLPL